MATRYMKTRMDSSSVKREGFEAEKFCNSSANSGGEMPRLSVHFRPCSRHKGLYIFIPGTFCNFILSQG